MLARGLRLVRVVRSFQLFVVASSFACASDQQPPPVVDKPDAGEAGDARVAEDAGFVDAASFDAGEVDASILDASTADAGFPDAGFADAGFPDSGPAIWRPAPGTSWQWQLTEQIDTSVDVDMYDIDLFDTPQSTIDRLHADGRIVICYFSAGSREEWRPDEGDFPQSTLGNPLDGWPGERWIDIRSTSVRNIMASRLDLAVQKRCDGVEPDNVDGYTNNPGFPLRGSHQLDYNRFLASEAHARNLSIGLKNDVDQVTDLVNDFDWALNEECFEYDECDTLRPFINAGKAVFSVEYGTAGLAGRVCPRANAANFDTLIKRLDLDAWRIACR